MVIWKWTLGMTDRQTLHIPMGARLLRVQVQGDYPRLWALCDPSAHSVPRILATYGTGAPVPDNPGVYIDSYLVAHDALVFHVFDVTDL